MEQQELQRESANHAGAPQKSAALSAVHAFVKHGFKQQWYQFYEKYSKDSGNYATDLASKTSIFGQLEYYLLTHGWSEGGKLVGSLEAKTAFFEQIQKFDLLGNEMLSQSIAAKGLTKSVQTFIEREFDLDEPQKRWILRKIDHLPINELKLLSKDNTKRERFVLGNFQKAYAPEKKAVGNIFKELELVGLTDQQKAIIRKEIEHTGDGALSEELVRTLIGAASNQAQKRKLIDGFFPGITLRDLEEFGIADKSDRQKLFAAQVKEHIENYINAGRIAEDAKATVRAELEESLFDNEDILDIPLDYLGLTSAGANGLSDDQVDHILAGSGFHKKAESVLQNGWLALENDTEELWVEEWKIDTAAPEGTLTPRDISEIKKKIDGVIQATSSKKWTPKISGLELLKKPEQIAGTEPPLYISGSFPDEEGEDSRLDIKIGKWYKRGDKIVTKIENVFENSVNEVQEITLNDFSILVRGLRTGRILSPIQYETEVRAKKTLSATDEKIVLSLDELTTRINDIDPAGKSISITEGMSFSLGSPGKDEYNIGTITKVGQESLIIRNTLWGEEEIPFTRFAFGFKKHGGKRLAISPSSPDKFLLAKQNDYEWLEYDKDKKLFVNSKKKDDKSHKWVRYFIGEDKKWVEVDSIKDGRVRFRYLEDFKEPKIDKDTKKPMNASAQFGEYVERPIEAFYMITEWNKAKPYEVEQIQELSDVPFEKTGWTKFLFWGPSFVDAKKGITQIVDHVKDALKHHNEAQSAKIALKLVEWMGLSKEVVAEFRGRVNAEGKKRLTTQIESLNDKYTSPERQKLVLKYLLDRSSDTERIVACACSIMGKHGNLYPWDLAAHEGEWLYFKRLPGSKEEKQKFIYGKGFSEEQAVFLWLMELSKATPPRVNSFYWQQCKKHWDSGASSEVESGGKEAEVKKTMKDRSEYSYWKFKGMEYAHAVWAMEKTWDKVSDNFAERMRMPFILAMSDAPSNMHNSLVQKFKRDMYKKGAFYAPLLFIEEPAKQIVFRNVVRKLAAENNLKGSFDEIDQLIKSGKNPAKLIEKLNTFWEQNGNKLYKKLSITMEEPEIFLKKDQDPDYGNYYETIKSILGEWVDFKDPELDSWAMSQGGIGWGLINAKEYMKKIKYNTGPGGIQEGISEFIFNGVFDQLNDIRKYSGPKESTASPEQIDQDRKKLFKEVHKAYFGRMYSPSGLSADHWKIDKDTGERKIKNNVLLAKFKDYGFDIYDGDQAAGLAVLENEARYESEWLDRDYERFKKWQMAMSTVVNTNARMQDIMNLVKRGKPAANNSSNQNQQRAA